MYFVRILEKIDCVIMAPHCNGKTQSSIAWFAVSAIEFGDQCNSLNPHFILVSREKIRLLALVVVVLLFLANNTAMERYNIIQNKLLEATREAIRLIGLVALIMAYKVNKCMWPTGVRGQGSDRGMPFHQICQFRFVRSTKLVLSRFHWSQLTYFETAIIAV